MKHSQYVAATGRQLVGLVAPQHGASQFNRLFGAISDGDLVTFSEKAFANNFRAAFGVSAKVPAPTVSCDFDVLVIREDTLALPAIELDALLLHELCHWYIDADLQMTTPMPCCVDALRRGSDLYNRTDSYREYETRHTLSFCQLLCEASIRAENAGLLAQGAEAFAVTAMKFDIDFETDADGEWP